MIEFLCGYEPEHTHSYPDDWQFGGPNETDPRGDTRYRATTYQYFSDRAQIIHTTQVPLCDDQAIDEFTRVAGWGPGFNPVWLKAKRPDGREEMVPWVYDKSTDTVTPS